MCAVGLSILTLHSEDFPLVCRAVRRTGPAALHPTGNRHPAAAQQEIPRPSLKRLLRNL